MSATKAPPATAETSSSSARYPLKPTTTETAVASAKKVRSAVSPSKARRSGQIGNPRAAMKFVVEVLDLARHLPDALGRVAEQIERDTIF